MKNKGFTIIEVVIAIFLITVGIGSSVALINRNNSFNQTLSSRLVAVYLSQEGIEIVRNIRDTNWLSSSGWNVGLGAGDWQADYTSVALSAYTGSLLNIDASGFYGYGAGTATKYKRKITISYPQADIMDIVVRVEWLDRGSVLEFTTRGRLYQWQ